MAKEINMPKFGMSMLEGEVVKWLKKEGEQINVGDEIVEINENKATHTIESMHSGTLEEILVEEGDIAEIGATLALVAE